jgi:CheY-like chemotaxis protein
MGRPQVQPKAPVEHWGGQRPRPQPPHQPEQQRSARQVLVVDDDRMLREVLVGALEDEGYVVRSARNGREALALLEQWRPDVILLDLMMPEMDGWAFRSRQLQLPASADIPVIVLSAGPNLRYGVDSLRSTAIFPKPFDLDLLLATVDKVT